MKELIQKFHDNIDSLNKLMDSDLDSVFNFEKDLVKIKVKFTRILRKLAFKTIDKRNATSVFKNSKTIENFKKLHGDS